MKRTTPKEEVVVEPAIAEEIIAIAPEEIQAHLQWGKAHFKAGRYTEALKEFEAILKTAPGSIETRIWIRKVKEELTKPKIEAIAEEEAAPAAEGVKPKDCIWMKLGMVSGEARFTIKSAITGLFSG